MFKLMEALMRVHAAARSNIGEERITLLTHERNAASKRKAERRRHQAEMEGLMAMFGCHELAALTGVARQIDSGQIKLVGGVRLSSCS